ncbi:MAG: ferredoxin [Bradymonadia bacterium]|jgi:ferredoxin
MATIFFAGDGFEREVADGSKLQDAIDSAGAAIMFGCREGNCATCMIVIHEGVENLNKPTDEEQMTLLPDELADGVRLACQCKVVSGRISIEAAPQ